MKKTLITFLMISVIASIYSQELSDIILPPPVRTGGMPLMEALDMRRSQREFSDRPFTWQEISNLLWAANGFNRDVEGKRTAPSAMNSQEIDIYVSISSGVYLYDAKLHVLTLITAGDYRSEMGRQRFVGDAPLVLIYVVDYVKMSFIMDSQRKDFYSATDVGFVSQNVYLYAASENLATVVLGLFSEGNISRVIPLRRRQKVLLTQPVGFPKE